MRKLKYEEALKMLNSGAESFGIDMVVISPVQFLEMNMRLSYASALSCLKELERRGIITLDREGCGGAITRARIHKAAVPERFHEAGQRERLVLALWKHKRQSQKYPGKYIVHSLAFADVSSEADILHPVFYRLLEEFEKSDWIQYEREANGRIVYILLTPKFPVP